MPLNHDFNLDSRFFYRPITLTVLAVGLALLAYVATTNDVLEEGKDKQRLYAFYPPREVILALCSYVTNDLKGVFMP